MRDVSTHASLLARLKDGSDAAAWETFSDRYRDLVFHFARRRGLQPADAEDVAQDVLAAAHRALPTFAYDPAVGSFRGWLKTAASRAVLKKRRPTADALARAVDDDAAALAAEVADPASAEAWDVEWRRYHVRLATAKVRLEFPLAAMRAFEGCALEERPAAEVAAELGMSVDAVYKAKSRIVARLREHVAAQAAEEG